MTKRSGAQALVRVLAAHGVEHVFGLCGHTIVPALAALESSKIRFVGVHHEQAAAHAADAYARVTGEPQVVLCHLGPGMTNALTGVANACLDDVPMVVVAGNVQSYFQGRHAHMETTLHADASQSEAYRPWCKRVWRVERPEALVPALDAAFVVARSGRPGPVLVDVAMDVFSSPVEIPDEFVPRVIRSATTIDPGMAEVTADLLLSARRPVIYAGEEAGRRRAGGALVVLAEALGAPLAYALMAKGAVPDSHPLCVGMSGFWGTPAANAACREADVLFAVGATFSELDASSWEPGKTFAIPPTRLVHSHEDASEIGRSYPAALGVCAPADAFAVAVAERVLARMATQTVIVELPSALRDLKRQFADQLAPARAADDMPLRPERVLAEVERLMASGNIVLVGDTGWNKNGVGQQVCLDAPGRFVVAGGYATMGFGPAAALGVALAAPERSVIAMVGDGAFLANPAVVVTAVEERIPVVWVVMNNGTYATISGMQGRHFGSDYGSSFDASRTDYAALASAVGGVGARVERADQLGPLIAEALASRKPWVIDVPCSRENVPTTGAWEINELFGSGIAVDAAAERVRNAE